MTYALVVPTPQPDAADPTRPKVGVGVLLIDDRGRILLTLRKRPPEAGCWSIVGGKLDYFEPLEKRAAREALEEVGVEIAIERLLCVTDHCLPEEGQHWVAPAYLGPHCQRPRHQPRAGKDRRSPLVQRQRTPCQSDHDRRQRHPRLSTRPTVRT